MTCEACDGTGWILADRESAGVLEIQRCDACEQFTTDDEALVHVAMVARLAMVAEGAQDVRR
jgi:hypothetical protein